MRKPLISVIVPVFNRPEALKRTLNSVIKQSYPLIEIIVIDDGSDIDIYPVIDELKDNRITYHKLEHKNANVARNYGIEHSKGEYIAMLDADDLWLENHIEECLRSILESKTDGIYGSLILKNMQTGKKRNSMVRPLHENESMIDYLLSTGYGAQTSTLFMTAKSAKDTLWNPTLNRHQDYDFILRYSKKYKLTPKLEATTIYCMGEPKQLTIDFNSCIQVILENEDEISPNLYNNYHLSMLSLAKRQRASDNIILHYKQEATRYKEHISFYQFLTIKEPKSTTEFEQYRAEYIKYLNEIEVE